MQRLQKATGVMLPIVRQILLTRVASNALGLLTSMTELAL